MYSIWKFDYARVVQRMKMFDLIMHLTMCILKKTWRYITFYFLLLQCRSYDMCNHPSYIWFLENRCGLINGDCCASKYLCRFLYRYILLVYVLLITSSTFSVLIHNGILNIRSWAFLMNVNKEKCFECIKLITCFLLFLSSNSQRKNINLPIQISCLNYILIS